MMIDIPYALWEGLFTMLFFGAALCVPVLLLGGRNGLLFGLICLIVILVIFSLAITIYNL